LTILIKNERKTKNVKSSKFYLNRTFGAVLNNAIFGVIDKMVGRIFYSSLIVYLCSKSKVMNKKDAFIAAVQLPKNMV